MRRFLVLPLALLAAVAALAPAASVAAPRPLVGAIHEHTGYSDGAVGTRPADAFAAGRAQGLDFMASTEHAEILSFPGTLGEDCLSAQILGCVLADTVEPANALRKWAAIGEQAAAASQPGAFTAIRGFEWTSDRSGHLGVLFSANTTSAYLDGGNLDVNAFWRWFATQGEALGIFNHPGDKGLGEWDPAFNWKDFTYNSGADERMIGLETFNGGSEYLKYYDRALERGWHVGAIGGEDVHTKDWGVASKPKTVVLADDNSAPGIKAALAARRFYATRRAGISLSFTIDGAPMGSRLTRKAGAPLLFQASATPGGVVELIGPGGAVLADSGGSLYASRAATNTYYYLRVRHGDTVVAVSSPIWIATGS
jgi:hypothetical protein